MQFYLNCAHIDILGPGGGSPGPVVKIPGAYVVGQKDVFFDISGMFDVGDYRAPYPPVWMG